MTDDIVTRLWDVTFTTWEGDKVTEPACEEAVAEIVFLRKEVASLREAVSSLREAGTELWAWMIINANTFQQGGVGYQHALRNWQDAQRMGWRDWND